MASKSPDKSPEQKSKVHSSTIFVSPKPEDVPVFESPSPNVCMDFVMVNQSLQIEAPTADLAVQKTSDVSSSDFSSSDVSSSDDERVEPNPKRRKASTATVRKVSGIGSTSPKDKGDHITIRRSFLEAERDALAEQIIALKEVKRTLDVMLKM